MSTYATTDPTTGERTAEFATLSDVEVQELLTQSSAAYRAWRSAPLADRTKVLNRTAELHAERSEELAALLTLETGKPITEARQEVALVASIYKYYADNAERFLQDEPLEISGPGEAFVRTEAIGPIVGVMPWNFPYYQVARFAAPNLALGNSVIVKHASNCPQSALAIESILRDAGLPFGLYANAFATTTQVATMIADPRVQGVSLTGSERAGAAVAEIAGRHLKKVVLELGGSDPFIVLGDADLSKAVADAVAGRMYNAGQACTASKRFIVVDDVYEQFVENFLEEVTKIVPGDPTDDLTSFGPLSSHAAAAELTELIDDAVGKGAQVVSGSAGPGGNGAYFPATVLTGVTPDMRAYSEELFGPVAVVYRVDSAAEAVTLANDSPFGLASSIYTSDAQVARDLAEQLETGMVWINSISRSAPDLPFGGVKKSGIGRELAKFGMNEFANKKLVRIPASGPLS